MAGENEILVETNWQEAPLIVNANATYDTYVWVKDLTPSSFTLVLKQTPEKDEKIYWSAMW